MTKDRDLIRIWMGVKDKAMDGCWQRAVKLYNEGRHEEAAYGIADFMSDHILPDEPGALAVLAIVRQNARIASYNTNNRGTKLLALQTLLRLVLPFQQREGYDPDWTPSDFNAADVI